MSNDYLIIAAGEALGKDDLLSLMQDKVVLALDSALHQLFEYGLKPNILLGDMDSVDLKAFADTDYLDGIELLCLEDQNHTDLDKALAYVHELRSKSVVIVGAQCGRMDHSLHAFVLLHRYHALGMNLRMLTSTEHACMLQNERVRLRGEVGSGVAILGWLQATVSTDGLQYESKRAPYAFLGASSICNKMSRDEAVVTVRGDALLLVDRSVSVERENGK